MCSAGLEVAFLDVKRTSAEEGPLGGDSLNCEGPLGMVEEIVEFGVVGAPFDIAPLGFLNWVTVSTDLVSEPLGATRAIGGFGG
jgi:hypothetical protein